MRSTWGAFLLTERMILYMTEKEFMSGSELRQYLHISTRKMKYLMDNNYIPHENTGHTTHKYRVRPQPAAHSRMDTGRSSGRHQARLYTVLRQSGIRELYGFTAKAGAPAHGKIQRTDSGIQVQPAP